VQQQQPMLPMLLLLMLMMMMTTLLLHRLRFLGAIGWRSSRLCKSVTWDERCC
jgi:hypothetical protein